MARKRKTYQEIADKISADLGRLSNNMAALTGYVPDGEPGGDQSLARTFDHICTVSAMLATMSGGARTNFTGASKRADVVKRQIRRALGYTVP